MTDEDFTGYVLTGGKSSRMGADKAFLKIGNETFIDRAIDALKPVCEDRIRIVLNSNQANFIEKLPVSISYIFDIFESRGALGGIHAALRDCRSEWAIILAVDLPFVNETVVKFLAVAAADSTGDAAAVIPRQPDGRLQPLCGLYRSRLCSEKLEELPQTHESLSVRSFLENLSVRFVDPAEFPSASGPWFLNVNTPTDYEKLLAEK